MRKITRPFAPKSPRGIVGSIGLVEPVNEGVEVLDSNIDTSFDTKMFIHES